MSKKTQKTVELLWGLPGSGKTTYASSFGKVYQNSKISVIDIDKLAKNLRVGTKLVDVIAQEVENHLHYNNSHLILDGLVTTNEVAKNIFAAIFKKETQYELIFKITYWKRDVEACLHNDKFRRSKDSKVTIENLPYEEPDLKILGEYVKERVERKRVILKPDSDIWIESMGYNKILKSETWCLGGTWGDCWGASGTVSPTPQPNSFAEFDDLLLKISPSMSFLQYKKLYNETVTVESTFESSYYGGGAHYGHYQCDLLKLYEMLIELDLISNEA